MNFLNFEHWCQVYIFRRFYFTNWCCFEVSVVFLKVGFWMSLPLFWIVVLLRLVSTYWSSWLVVVDFVSFVYILFASFSSSFYFQQRLVLFSVDVNQSVIVVGVKLLSLILLHRWVLRCLGYPSTCFKTVVRTTLIVTSLIFRLFVFLKSWQRIRWTE